MSKFHRLAIATSVGALLTLSSLHASEWDKKTTVNFNQKVEVPGTVLEPGRYVMRLVDLTSNRHVVQFLNDRENHVYAAAMAIPTYREQVTNRTVISFYEAPVGRPEAIRTWYYPGDQYGQEFVYPHKRALEIAAVTKSVVPSDAYPERSESPIEANGTAVAATPRPVFSNIASDVDPASPQPVEIAQIQPQLTQQQPPATPNGTGEPALPDTASRLGNIIAFGMICLLGGVMVRKIAA